MTGPTTSLRPRNGRRLRLKPAHILSYRGSQDGIRWGDIILPGNHHRRFAYDMISGVIRLFVVHDHSMNMKHVDDLDPERVAIARVAILAHA